MGDQEAVRRRAKLESIDTKCVRTRAFPSLKELFPSLDGNHPTESTLFDPEQFLALSNKTPEELWNSLINRSSLDDFEDQQQDYDENQDESELEEGSTDEPSDPIVGQENPGNNDE
jgi:hypothetical protein